VEDQLSLAGMHFLRGHYQEATDLYKRILLEQRDNLALNIYVALCYYKLDYYDVSLEILSLYLSRHPGLARLYLSHCFLLNSLSACALPRHTCMHARTPARCTHTHTHTHTHTQADTHTHTHTHTHTTDRD